MRLDDMILVLEQAIGETMRDAMRDAIKEQGIDLPEKTWEAIDYGCGVAAPSVLSEILFGENYERDRYGNVFDVPNPAVLELYAALEKAIEKMRGEE